MELTSLFATDNKNSNLIKIIKINDYTSSNIKHAMAVATGQQLNSDNDLKDLPGIYEFSILSYFKTEITELRRKNKKFIFICDITNFPYCCCYIDPTDDKFKDDLYKFGRDIQKLWDYYDKNKIITIVVNIHIPHTGLKHIAF